MEVEGIVTSVTPYHEKDGIVNLLTIDGFVTFSARGILKIDAKLSSLCQLYNLVLVDLEQNKKSGHLTLKSGRIIRSLKTVYENIEAMLTLGFLVELAKKTLDEDNKQKLYQNCVLAIDAIVNQKDLASVRLVYLASVINLVGLNLDVNECVRCGSQKAIASLSLQDGGYICKKCLNHDDIINTPIYIKLARYIFIADIKESIKKVLPEYESKLLFHELYKFLQDNLGLKLNSIELLGKILH